jgi:nucleotide-binding universal stress UspA family protein
MSHSDFVASPSDRSASADVSTPVPTPVASDPSLGEQLRRGALLVAVTGGADTPASVSVASALENRYAPAVSAVQVIDISDAPLLAPLPSMFTLARDLIGDVPYAEDARARRRQFSELLGKPNEWPVHIGLGSPAQEILRCAEGNGAALIVMGLRRHGTVDRILRDETTLTVARRAHGAVLAVVPDTRGLPQTAVVGVDFGPASVRAARAALDVLARPAPGGAASLRLVYVDANGFSGGREAAAGEALIHRLGVKAAFELLIGELDAPSDVSVDWTVVEGAAGSALLKFAAECRADLIAVGSLRHERLERWILGSVTTEIVRDGRCSVLVIPPR